MLTLCYSYFEKPRHPELDREFTRPFYYASAIEYLTDAIHLADELVEHLMRQGEHGQTQLCHVRIARAVAMKMIATLLTEAMRQSRKSPLRQIVSTKKISVEQTLEFENIEGSTRVFRTVLPPSFEAFCSSAIEHLTMAFESLDQDCFATRVTGGEEEGEEGEAEGKTTTSRNRHARSIKLELVRTTKTPDNETEEHAFRSNENIGIGINTVCRNTSSMNFLSRGRIGWVQATCIFSGFLNTTLLCGSAHHFEVFMVCEKLAECLVARGDFLIRHEFGAGASYLAGVKRFKGRLVLTPRQSLVKSRAQADYMLAQRCYGHLAIYAEAVLGWKDTAMWQRVVQLLAGTLLSRYAFELRHKYARSKYRTDLSEEIVKIHNQLLEPFTDTMCDEALVACLREPWQPLQTEMRHVLEALEVHVHNTRDAELRANGMAGILMSPRSVRAEEAHAGNPSSSSSSSSSSSESKWQSALSSLRNVVRDAGAGAGAGAAGSKSAAETKNWRRWKLMPHDISSATADAVREYAQVLSFAWHRVENDRSRGTTPARSATAASATSAPPLYLARKCFRDLQFVTLVTNPHLSPQSLPKSEMEIALADHEWNVVKVHHFDEGYSAASTLAVSPRLLARSHRSRYSLNDAELVVLMSDVVITAANAFCLDVKDGRRSPRTSGGPPHPTGGMFLTMTSTPVRPDGVNEITADALLAVFATTPSLLWIMSREGNFVELESFLYAGLFIDANIHFSEVSPRGGATVEEGGADGGEGRSKTVQHFEAPKLMEREAGDFWSPLAQWAVPVET